MVNQTYVDDKVYEWEGYYVRDIMASPGGGGGWWEIMPTFRGNNPPTIED
jgi:hypothetical protein